MGNDVKSDASRLTMVALTMVLLAVVAACGGEATSTTTISTSISLSTTSTSLPQPTSPSSNAAVSAVPVEVDSLCDLVTFEETEAALSEFVSGELAQDAFPGTIDLTQPGDYSCRHETDSGTYVEVAIGSPADFETGAELEGVVGETVAGIGDAAVWFAGTTGVLGLRQGDVHLRITLNLPEVDPTDQLEAATELAAAVIERLP